MQIHDAVLRRKAKAGGRGYKYEVLIGDEVIANSRDPEHAACRALLAKGVTGTVRFWSDVYGPQKDCRSSLDIERGAKVSVTDPDRGVVRAVWFSEYWGKQEDGEDAELEIAA